MQNIQFVPKNIFLGLSVSLLSLSLSLCASISLAHVREYHYTISFPLSAPKQHRIVVTIDRIQARFNAARPHEAVTITLRLNLSDFVLMADHTVGYHIVPFTVLGTNLQPQVNSNLSIRTAHYVSIERLILLIVLLH